MSSELPEYVRVEFYRRNDGIVKISGEDKLREWGDENWKEKFEFGASGPVTLVREAWPFRETFLYEGEGVENNEQGHATRTLKYRLKGDDQSDLNA
jgi:hypothetical protein